MCRLALADRQLRAEAKRQLGIAERNAISGRKPGSFDRFAVQQRLVALARREVDENELIIGRPLDQRMMAVHRRMIERDIVIAVPTDAQQLPAEYYWCRTLADLDPRLAACGNVVMPGHRTNFRHLITAPQGAPDSKQPSDQRHRAGKPEADDQQRRALISLDDLLAGLPRAIDDPLVKRLHRELQDLLGYGFRWVAGRDRSHG